MQLMYNLFQFPFDYRFPEEFLILKGNIPKLKYYLQYLELLLPIIKSFLGIKYTLIRYTFIHLFVALRLKTFKF